jgi:hypothetical protein
MPDGPPPPAPGTVPDAWLRQADTLRRQADEIERVLRDLLAYDRPDVWEGGLATAFREELADHVRALQSPAVGATSELREMARRIEVRAGAAITSSAPTAR